MKDARLIPEMAGETGPEKPAGLGLTPRRKKGFMLSRRMRGFSLIEMMVVVALILIVLAWFYVLAAIILAGGVINALRVGVGRDS